MELGMRVLGARVAAAAAAADGARAFPAAPSPPFFLGMGASGGGRGASGAAAWGCKAAAWTIFFLFRDGVNTAGLRTGGDGPFHYQRFKSNATQNRR